MTPADIVAVLSDLKFQTDFRTIQLDAQVRDYLVTALIARHGKA